MISIIKVHNLAWVVVLLFYIMAPFNYVLDIQFKSFSLILIYFLFSNIFFWIGFSINSISPYSSFSEFKRKYIYIIYSFSFMYFILYLYKVFSLGEYSNFSFSLFGFTQLRYDLVNSDEYESGSLLSGVFSTIFSGFPGLAIIFLYYFYTELKRKDKIILFSIWLLGILYSLIGGGRNGAVILILCFLFSFYSSRAKILYTKNYRFNKYRKFLIFFSIISFFVFSKIFLDRAVYTSGNLEAYINYLESTSEHNLKNYSKVLLNNRLISPFYFPIFMFHNYLSHSIFELIETLNSHPLSFPFFGAYQFHFVTLFLNKFGFNFISISQISSEIVNPGRYFTLIGAVYLDYGVYGFVPFISFVFFMLGRLQKKYILKPSIFNSTFYIFSLIFVLFSPIFSVLNISNFQPLVFNTLILYIISKFKI